MKSLLSLIGLCWLLMSSARTQDIYFNNPSFEDTPQHSKAPQGWTDCGFLTESPPDIQPNSTLNTYQPAFDGRTYLALVVKDNGTWESVGQQLSRPMKPRQCYELAFFAAHSTRYISTSRKTGRVTDYKGPVILRFYGGFDYCDRKQLLAKTEAITDPAWNFFSLLVVPNEAFDYLTIEAFFQPGDRYAYNGNVLLDRLYPLKLRESTPEEMQNMTQRKKSGAATASIQADKNANDQSGIPMAVGEQVSPVETIQFEQAVTLNELRDIVQHYGPHITFSLPEEELKRSTYLLSVNRYYQNQELHRIVESLRHFPRVRLIIGVDSSSATSFEQRKTELKWALQELHLPRNQYQIIDFNSRKGARKNWLWQEEGLAVYMNLSLR